jgi:DNA-binding NarL/FixJ family response regulator
MLFAGASGYVVKAGNPEELIGAIRVVMGGGRFLSGKIQLPSTLKPKPDRSNVEKCFKVPKDLARGRSLTTAVPGTPKGAE